jgi:hypothetical protein
MNSMPGIPGETTDFKNKWGPYAVAPFLVRCGEKP